MSNTSKGLSERDMAQAIRSSYNQVWSKEEDEVIYRYYYEYGVEKCSEYLPKRTESAIYNHANWLGLKRKKSNTKELSELILKKIKDEKITFSEACDDLKISRNRMYGYFRLHNIKFSHLYTELSQYKGITHPNQGFHYIFTQYRTNSKQRNINFELTIKDIETITQQDCYYCGAKPKMKVPRKNHKVIYNGIDRVDNTLGYIKTNIVPCCNDCNLMKSNYSVDEFKKQISKIYSYYILGLKDDTNK